ncbi:MAG: hypothetical protein K2L67_06835 [Clostridia bacterium]|nr:hypothetical protein [Clostridia bacterium]
MKKFFKDSLRNRLALKAEIENNEITRENVKLSLIRDIISLIFTIPLCALSFVFGIFIFGLFLSVGLLFALYEVICGIITFKNFEEIMKD